MEMKSGCLALATFITLFVSFTFGSFAESVNKSANPSTGVKIAIVAAAVALAVLVIMWLLSFVMKKRKK